MVTIYYVIRKTGNDTKVFEAKGLKTAVSIMRAFRAAGCEVALVEPVIDFGEEFL